MSHFFGNLKISMFITMPNGRDKRTLLASIPCEHAECESTFRKFMDNNPQLLKSSMAVEFVYSEPLLY